MKFRKLVLCMCVLGACMLGMVSCQEEKKPETETKEPSVDTPADEQENDVEEYTLTYNTNGGDAIPSQTVKYGEEFTLVTPVREGYVFEGWYYGPVPFSDGIWEYTIDVTVDAQWSEAP